MSTFVSILLPFVIVGLVVFFSMRNSRRKKNLLQNGVPVLAEVLEIGQTGSSVNNVPVMRLRVRIEQAGVPPREVMLRQLIDMGNMPRMGEQVALLLDPVKPDNILYVGLAASVAGQAAAAQASGGQGSSRPVGNGSMQSGPGGDAPAVMTAEQIRDALALAPVLRENGKLGIGRVLSWERAGTLTRMTFEVDSVVDPKYNVQIEQAWNGPDFAPGERAYLVTDPNDPQSAALMPLSLVGGKKLDPRMNRLDPLVLDPQLKASGRTGQGTILSAEKITLHNPVLAAMGMTRWHLKARILPDDGSMAYDAEQDITMTGPEKVTAMCTVGRTIPVRYDAHDPKTWCTDGVAMGFPDPYKDQTMWDKYKVMAAQMPAGTP